MKIYISLYFLLVAQWCTAQQPFKDDKNAHTRTIFEGKASILLPDEFSYGRQVFLADSEVLDAASYSDRKRHRNIYCSIYRNEVSQEKLYEHYIGVKTMYTDEYVVVLKDEFVADGDNSYFFYECRLKDELYRKPGQPVYEIEDTAVTGMVIPNYFCFYFFLQNGVLSEIIADYQGDIEGLEDYRRLSRQIIHSYKLIE